MLPVPLGHTCVAFSVASHISDSFRAVGHGPGLQLGDHVGVARLALGGAVEMLHEAFWWLVAEADPALIPQVGDTCFVFAPYLSYVSGVFEVAGSVLSDELDPAVALRRVHVSDVPDALEMYHLDLWQPPFVARLSDDSWAIVDLEDASG